MGNKLFSKKQYNNKSSSLKKNLSSQTEMTHYLPEPSSNKPITKTNLSQSSQHKPNSQVSNFISQLIWSVTNFNPLIFTLDLIYLVQSHAVTRYDL